MPPIHSFGALGTKTNVIFETLVAGPFLFHSLFPLLRFGSQKPLADFPLMGDRVWVSWNALPKSRLLILSPVSQKKRHLRALAALCLFPLNGQIPPFWWWRHKGSQPPSFFVHLSCSTWGPRLLHQVPSPKPPSISINLFWILGSWWEMTSFISCAHKHAVLSCPHLS